MGILYSPHVCVGLRDPQTVPIITASVASVPMGSFVSNRRIVSHWVCCILSVRFPRPRSSALEIWVSFGVDPSTNPWVGFASRDRFFTLP